MTANSNINKSKLKSHESFTVNVKHSPATTTTTTTTKNIASVLATAQTTTVESVFATAPTAEHTPIPNPTKSAEIVTELNSDSELSSIKKKMRICEENLKIAKSMIRKSSQLNIEKDLKLKELLENPEKSNDTCPSNDVLFDGYSDRFSAEDLTDIRLIGPESSKDSTFISRIMNALYKNDLGKLNERSATGRRYCGTIKHEITFEKKEIMHNMLAERIKTEIRDRFGTSFEFSKRVKRLNLLIRFAIGNLKPKKGNSKQNIEASWTDRSRNLPNRDSSNAQGLMANQNDDRVRHLSFFPIDFFKNVHLNHIFKHF